MSDQPAEGATANPREALREVAGLFLRLGTVAYGGPAAHIAMMHDEIVNRRRWMGDQQFLDLIGVTNLIPGPNSTELAIHLGLVRAGWRGLVAAGVLFILPAFLMVLALAVAYDRWGTTPGGDALLYGIKPVVIAVIVQAIWRLGRTAVRPAPWLVVPGVLVAALYLLGVNELLLLFAGGIAIAVMRRAGDLLAAGAALLPPLAPAPLLLAAVARTPVEFSILRLFLEFLRIGAVLYGSGYVLVAFLQGRFVDNLGWLTEQQLLDAVAIG
jgi:chromate transporter